MHMFSILSGKYLGGESLGHLVAFFFFFKSFQELQDFSKVAAPFCIPAKNIGGVQFLHILHCYFSEKR